MRLVSAISYTVLAIIVVLTQGCGKSGAPKDVFDMGEKVRVGALTYNVIETTWKSQLGEFPSARVPERNFLLIRVSVTNGGGTDRTMPALEVENSNGDSFTEVADGRGVDGWFGLIRRLSPAATDEGWVLFDVPTNAYRLKLSDPDSDSPRSTFINIPLHMPES